MNRISLFPKRLREYALAMAAISAGHLKAYKTTKLFGVEETMEAMRKASSITFQAPSQG